MLQVKKIQKIKDQNSSDSEKKVLKLLGEMSSESLPEVSPEQMNALMEKVIRKKRELENSPEEAAFWKDFS